MMAVAATPTTTTTMATMTMRVRDARAACSRREGRRVPVSTSGAVPEDGGTDIEATWYGTCHQAGQSGTQRDRGTGEGTERDSGTEAEAGV